MKRFLFIAFVVGFVSSSVSAKHVRIGHMYVSKGDMKTWAGSVDAAKSSDKWYTEYEWNIGRKPPALPFNGHDVFAVAELTADENFVQGLNIAGGNPVVRINGKEITAFKGDVYKLDLKAGKNTIEFMYKKREPLSKEKIAQMRATAKKKKRRFKMPAPPSAGSFLTYLDVEYIFTTPEDKMVFARRSIRHLTKMHRKYKGREYLKELDALEAKGASDEEVEAFRMKTLVMNNPELDFDEILFRQSGSNNMPSNWRGNSHYLRRQGKEFRPDFSDSVQVLNFRTGETRTIYEPSDKKEGVMDITLSYDAKKFLYSGVDTDSNTFEIYEMNIDGSGKRRISTKLPQIDNYNGVYLPNGKIIFCSTASMNSVPCVGGKDYVGTLYEMNADGSEIRQVTFDQENDWYPWVKDNGRVMYHRWEYTDNSHYFTRILLEMNPDGSNNRSIYGSNSYWPNTMFYAKQLPGRVSQFCAIVSGHHGAARAGELWVFDSGKGDFEGEGALRKIPGYGHTYDPLIVDNYMNAKMPQFLHPFPISENYFLVSAILQKGDRWGLYLVDTFDNMIKISEGGKEYQFEPMPIKTRKRPPIIPDQINRSAEDATVYIQDVYEGPGLKGVKRGEATALRIFAYGYAYRMTGSHDALAIEGGWDSKRVLGTVPIEDDGSVMFKIPHSLPVSLQPLDKEGRALQVMRSWLALQPGEKLSCVGCHEPSRVAPLSRMTKASNKERVSITPWTKYDKSYGFSFNREVQPILDRRCAGCHDGSKEGRPNFKDNTEKKFNDKAHFSHSYMALHPYVRRPGPESDLHVLTPMDYHTSTSELFQLLAKGHKNVKLSDEEMRTLHLWADLNVPYHGTWREVRDDKATQDFAKLTVKYKKMYANLNDDIEWVPEAELNKKRPEFIKPIPVKKPAPVTLKGWPLAAAGDKPKTKKIKVGGQELTMVRIPAGKFVMGSVKGQMDECPQAVVEIKKPFWISTTEVNNGQFREFKKDHDSRYIDMQWKDHVYAGYYANREEQPAIRVTWNEATAFAGWLSEKSGKKVMLPTEAQWEWAARAGSDQPFSFGTTGFEKHANLADESIALLAVRGVDPKPVPVKSRNQLNDYVPRDMSFNDGRLIPDGTAQYQPNAWGVYDMHGNVAEWTRSSYKPYPYKDGDGRNDVDADAMRVARGGSWRDRPKRATASCRTPYKPFQRVYNVGFRVIVEE